MPFADPEVQRRYLREYKREHRHRYKWRDKCYSAARHANQRAAERDVPGTLTADDVEVVLEVGTCWWCKAEVDRMDLTVDHRIGLGNPGSTNTPENIVPACDSCNKSKRHADRPGRWALDHDCCVDCGDTDRRHAGGGRCGRCYQRARKAAPPADRP